MTAKNDERFAQVAVNSEAPCRPRGPLFDAICELEVVRDNAQTNHDIAIREDRYQDAERHNARAKSMLKAIGILAAVDKAIVP